MVFLQTTCSSLTGRILYSDSYIKQYPADKKDHPMEDKIPVLTIFAAIPFVGHIAAIVRIVLAIFHMIGHAFAALIFWNKGHLCHVAKGAAELLRGIIELLPIIGRLFTWIYEMKPYIEVKEGETKEIGNFFIVKLYDPLNPDLVDCCLREEGKHPFFNKDNLP